MVEDDFNDELFSRTANGFSWQLSCSPHVVYPPPSLFPDTADLFSRDGNENMTSILFAADALSSSSVLDTR